MKTPHDAREFLKKMLTAQGWVPELFDKHKRSVQGGSADVMNVEQGPNDR